MPKRIKAVVFDLDGTITAPALDFTRIKQEIGTGDGPLLETMEEMTPKERKRAEEILERHEERAAVDSELNPGVRELFRFLKTQGIKTAILTRNSRRSTQIVLEKHGLEVDEVAAREDAGISQAYRGQDCAACFTRTMKWRYEMSPDELKQNLKGVVPSESARYSARPL